MWTGKPRHKSYFPYQDLEQLHVKDERGRVTGTQLRVVFGKKSEVMALLDKSTAYFERSNLTSRLFNARQGRKTLAFSKDEAAYRAAATWEDGYYNLVRPHKSLRLPATDGSSRKWPPRTPAIAAELTDHIWTVKELLTMLPVPGVNNP
ncbi:MAG: hypothetical protein Kow0063_34640 [Anaerolineae bacterium]